MKRISTILLLAFIAFTISCKKDGFKKSPPAKIYLVSKINIDFGNGYYRVFKYEYDDQNRISQAYVEQYSQRENGGGIAYKFIYDNESRVTFAQQLFQSNSTGNTVQLKFVYTYGKPDGKPEETDFVNGVTTTSYRVFLDNQGRIANVSKSLTSLYDSRGHLVYFGPYTDGDNIDPDKVYVTFDDKNNPFANAVGLNPYINYISSGSPIQMLNNMTSTGYFSGSGSATYTYNDANFPTKKAVKNFNNQEEVTTYEYTVR